MAWSSLTVPQPACHRARAIPSALSGLPNRYWNVRAAVKPDIAVITMPIAPNTAIGRAWVNCTNPSGRETRPAPRRA